ncbi:MAG: mechanosensitive ion channel family protein [Magnetococcales bacterium]|nr:mechanosensitive ion channel family protein [Magnetococcales bacterium]
MVLINNKTHLRYAFFALFTMATIFQTELKELLPDTPSNLKRIFVAAIGVGFWVGIGAVFSHLVDLILWRGVIFKRTGVQVPKLISDLTGVAIWLTTILVMIAFVFNGSFTGIVATSSVAMAVLGFAVKSLIADLFSGFAISLEHPFDIGDWIELESEAEVGQVKEITWRATRFITQSNVTIVIPNSKLAESTFKIYSRPSPEFRQKIFVTLDYNVTGYQAERILMSAVQQVEEVAKVKTPKVRIDSFNERGVVWELKYWLPDYGRLEPLRYAVMRKILRNLHFAGLSVPAIRIEQQQHHKVDHNPFEEDDALHHFIRRIPLFASLSLEDCNELAGQMHLEIYPTSRVITRQGEEGSSLFVIKEGLLNVQVMDQSGTQTIVGHLVPGDFFGENSALTGTPRAATVVAAVDSLVFKLERVTLQSLVSRRPEVARILSDFLAKRQMQTQQQLDIVGHTAKQVEELQLSLSSQIMKRILNLFNLSGEK